MGTCVHPKIVSGRGYGKNMEIERKIFVEIHYCSKTENDVDNFLGMNSNDVEDNLHLCPALIESR